MNSISPRTRSKRTAIPPLGIILLAGAFLLLSGCNFAPSTPMPDQVATESAGTLAAKLTEVVAAFTATAAAGSPTPSPTPSAQPTATMTATPQPTATATLRAVLPDWARFVDDITVADGATYRPGAEFTKTWRVMNIGANTWTTEYSLVFVRGDRMGGRRAIPLRGSVPPGYMIDLSVELDAPERDGDYRGYWALMDPDGEVFGIGADGKGAFWVDIEVDSPSKVVYDFVQDYCDAQWSSAAGALDCPGELTDSAGFVIRLPEPPIEDRVENEPGLWTEPEWVDSGYIQGRYPAFDVETGDRFRALVSCKADSPDCDVRFKVQYQIGSGAIETLGRWDERSDGMFTQIDLSLSDLAGERVRFILTVQARGVYAMDSGIWVAPAIWR